MIAKLCQQHGAIIVTFTNSIRTLSQFTYVFLQIQILVICIQLQPRHLPGEALDVDQRGNGLVQNCNGLLKAIFL